MVEIAHDLHSRAIDEQRPIKVICIGAGYSGILTAIRFPQRLSNLELVIYEKNADIGGTWFENVYPGAGCDVPSHGYQFTFAGNPNWSKFYAGGKEIHEYLKDVAWRYDVRKYVRLEHRFLRADWDSKTQKWTVVIKDLKNDKIFTDTADVFVRATGILNQWKWPNIPGLHTFKGDLMHTANFNPNFDWTGKNVALIGAGSTGIQVLPNIQPRAKRVFHYMKGKTWISPVGYAAEVGGGKNFEYTVEQRREFSEDPRKYHEYRHMLEQTMNKSQLVTFCGTDIQKEFWETADKFMKEKLNKKPEIYQSLRPDFPPGCRRLTPGPGYLEALLEENVEFIGTGIANVTETGILDMNGDFHEVDAIICATGFDYSYSSKDTPVFGRDGFNLDDIYTPGPQSYLGVTVPNMPNYFMFLGPASAPASGSFIPSLETIAEYIIQCVKKLQKEYYGSLEPTMEALKDFNEQADRYFAKTVFTYPCNSFFKGDKQQGRVCLIWPGSAVHFMEALRTPRWEDYRFELLPEAHENRFAWFGAGLTRSQMEYGKTSTYLDTVDIPPVINEGPRPDREVLATKANGHVVVNGYDGQETQRVANAVSTMTA